MAGILIDAHRDNAAKRRPGEPIHVTVRATKAAGTGTTLRVDIPQHEELGEMTVGDLKGLVAEAMSHAEVEEAELPLAAWGLQLYGRALNEAFPLASFHVQDKDTMYLRITPGQHDAAGVPINVERRPEAPALYTAELKADLRAAGAFRPGCTFAQLVELWRHNEQKKSRPTRLTVAVVAASCHPSLQVRRTLAKVERTGDTKALGCLYADIDHYGDPDTGELDSTGGLLQVQAVKDEVRALRAWRLAPPPPRAARPRSVYVCVTELERTYERAMLAEDAELRDALLLFDVDRNWLFRPTECPRASSATAQAQLPYVRTSADFRQLVLAKEEDGLVHYFRPHKDWRRVSAWLEGVADPTSGHKLQPLQMNGARWLSMAGTNGWQGETRQDGRKSDPDAVPRFTTNVTKVAAILKSGSFDFAPVMELLYQSNRNLRPKCGFVKPLANTGRT